MVLSAVLLTFAFIRNSLQQQDMLKYPSENKWEYLPVKLGGRAEVCGKAVSPSRVLLHHKSSNAGRQWHAIIVPTCLSLTQQSRYVCLPVGSGS